MCLDVSAFQYTEGKPIPERFAILSQSPFLFRNWTFGPKTVPELDFFVPEWDFKSFLK